MPLRPLIRSAIPCLAALLLLLAQATLAAEAVPEYQLEYVIGFDPEAGEVLVTVATKPGDGRLMRLRFSADPERHHGFSADGRLSQRGTRVTWRPPAEGGALRFRYRAERRRANGSFDARISADWALFRADRMLPPVAAIGADGARSNARLRFALPSGWSNADIGYPRADNPDYFAIANPGRRFQQPLGWMIAGRVGTRRDVFAGTEVSVAAPRGSTLRRNDVLAVAGLVLPSMHDLLGRLPDKILIVGADDPMWRGGLSAPTSLYLHADRPMISENGTSTLVHELMHVAGRLRGVRGHDWITEGLADYYAVRMLERAGVVTSQRAERTLAWLAAHGRDVRCLTATHSAGPRTARATTMFAAIDRALREADPDGDGLDGVVRELVDHGRIQPARLADAIRSRDARAAALLTPKLLDCE